MCVFCTLYFSVWMILIISRVYKCWLFSPIFLISLLLLFLIFCLSPVHYDVCNDILLVLSWHSYRKYIPVLVQFPSLSFVFAFLIRSLIVTTFQLSLGVEAYFIWRARVLPHRPRGSTKHHTIIYYMGLCMLLKTVSLIFLELSLLSIFTTLRLNFMTMSVPCCIW